MPGIDSLTTLAKRLSLGDRLIRRNPVFYGAALDWMSRLARAAPAERRDLIARRLRHALRMAAQTPYGREVRGGDSLESWPLLDKEQLRAGMQPFVRGRGWLAATAGTSGTTGLQVLMKRSLRSMAVEQAYIDAVMRRLGLEPSSLRMASLRGENVISAEQRRPPYWILSSGGRRMQMSCAHLGPETIRDYVAALREFAPHVLWVYPSNLEWLCRLLVDEGLELRVACVLSSSEMLGPAAWRMAADVLGARVADYYGQAERVAFGEALECGRFFFTPGYGHVELLPVDTCAGLTRFEIVGTTLWNDAMPLVRYRTGDFVELPADSSPAQIEEVCLGYRPVSGVLGRTVEYLVTPEGAILNGAGNITKNTTHVVRVQMLQEELGSVTVRLLVQPGFTDAELDQVRQNVRDNIGPTMAAVVEVVQELQRTPTGKTPLIIHGAGVRHYLATRHAPGRRGAD